MARKKWEVVELGHLVDPDRAISYGIVQPGVPVEDGVPIVRVSDIRNGRISTDDPLRVLPEVEAKYARTRLEGGELLLTLVGTVGEAAIAPPTLAGWNTARAVAVISVSDEVGADWVKWALRAAEVRERIGSRVNTTVQATLNLRDVARLPIVLPPKRERDAIGRALGALDNKIDVNRRIADSLEQIAHAVFESWFVDFDPVRGTATVPDDIRRLFPDRLVDSLIGPVPEGWEAVSLSKLMTVSREAVDPRNHPAELFYHYSLPAFDAGGVPVSERGADIKSSKLRVADGCILLSKLNPRIPRVCWPSSSGRIRRIASTEFVVTLPRDYFTRSYLFGLFTSAGFRSTLASLVRGTSGSHQRVSVTDLLDIGVLAPPRPLVERFDAIVAPMFNQQEALQAESKTLAELRDTLLPKLISGELQLAEPATRPA